MSQKSAVRAVAGFGLGRGLRLPLGQPRLARNLLLGTTSSGCFTRSPIVSPRRLICPPSTLGCPRLFTSSTGFSSTAAAVASGNGELSATIRGIQGVVFYRSPPYFEAEHQMVYDTGDATPAWKDLAEKATASEQDDLQDCQFVFRIIGQDFQYRESYVNTAQPLSVSFFC